MIRRDFFKAALATVAGLFGWKAAQPASDIPKIFRVEPNGALTCVRMFQLRPDDEFVFPDIACLKGKWRATAEPRLNSKGIWGIDVEGPMEVET